jgi:tetratricopeptide (TPR) repeat protein
MNASDKRTEQSDPSILETLPASNLKRCVVCGRKLPAANPLDSCPVCLLRLALAEDPIRHSSTSEQITMEALIVSSEVNPREFGSYRILTRPDGSLYELGHGAMGITFKALDIGLRIPVALKVLHLQLFREELARERFLREAQAAAGIRHPNVASVYHLGFLEREIYYAMEFVDGETLEDLIKRFGTLESKLAVEIVFQVTAGLRAIHQQNLVHRDIKPANIMVSFADGAISSVKIIDLGLAKAIDDWKNQTAFSIPGSFTGTAEFASPEQFTGVGEDVRSDLYSLGVTWWQMVTGGTPFAGTPPELMHQHLHSSPPFESLQDVPESIVTLLRLLLAKDPRDRIQSSADLLNIMGADRREGTAGLSIQNKRLTNPSFPFHRPAPANISVAGLPVTGREVFGREPDVVFLDRAWESEQVNVVTIVAWAGVGKSALVNHWLRLMSVENYRGAELVFAWSFYRQSDTRDCSFADDFLDSALKWFGDPNPRLGTAWEKGQRLAKLVAHRRTLFILDGLEVLQQPPGSLEGRLQAPSVKALVRELAAFNLGLCVITTRIVVSDLADHGSLSVQRLDLEQLSSEAGEQLLRASGVRGNPEELRRASDEFGGHCLALTLLGSYLTDAFHGDVRCRGEVSVLAHDERQGVQARRVMDSYQMWLKEGPALSVLRILGLFDRPVDAGIFECLLKGPSIAGLTESLTDLSPAAWQMIFSKLRRAKLLAGGDPHHPGYLDTHPLVREYFGEQLRRQKTDAWIECNRRLYDFYREAAPDLPDHFKEMEPLFLAVMCGCRAGLFRETLREIYVRRLQRGATFYTANVLGAREALLAALVHFFQQGRWDSLLETGHGTQSLTPGDQLYILMQAGLYLTATRGLGSPEARKCYERAEVLCLAVNDPHRLHIAMVGQWRNALLSGKLSVAMLIAKRVYSLAAERNEASLLVGAYRSLAATLYFLGDFEGARQNASRAFQKWRSEGSRSVTEEPIMPAISSLCYQGLCDWHLGEVASCRAAMAEAISLAKELNDAHALSQALWFAAFVGHFEHNVAETERLASELIDLSTRHSFAFWMAGGAVLRGWAQTASGDAIEGISSIERALRDYRATSSVLDMPYLLALKAESLHAGGRTGESVEAIAEAEAWAETSQVCWWSAELQRLRGVFLAAVGEDRTIVKTSFSAAIRIAKEQKSISLERRAETTLQNYRGLENDRC